MELTAAGYMKTRLEQLELNSMFGVAGNHTISILGTILADDNTPITLSENPNWPPAHKF